MENTNAVSKENNAQLGTVEFLGKPLTVITTDSQLLVAMRPICEGIGLDWKSQYERIKRDEVLSTSMVVMTTQMPGDDQKRQVTCLPLSMLNGWLFGVESRRCKPFIRQALVRYKFECYDALAAYWQQCSAKALPEPAALPAPIEQQELTLDYEGRRLRIVRLAGTPWLVAADLALALGLRNSYVILRRLPEEQQRKVLFGKQQVNILNMDGVRRTLLAADQARAEAFGKWLGQALEVPTQDASNAQPDPGSLLRGMLAGNRFMCLLDGQGRVTLREIPEDHITIAVGQIPSWIADPCGAQPELLPSLLQAVTERVVGQVGNRVIRG